MKRWINYFCIIIIFVFFCFWIWFKFIRERLPKDIPFTLSLLGACIIIIICLSYLYAIYLLIISLNRMKKIKSFLAVERFDYFFKSFQDMKQYRYIKKYHAKITGYLILKGSKNIVLLVWVPYAIRIISLFILLIDIYNSKLYFIYRFVYLYVIIYMIQFFVYSCKIIYEERLNYLNENIYLDVGANDSTNNLKNLINILTVLKQDKKPMISYSFTLKDRFLEQSILILRKYHEKPRLNIKKAMESFEMIINFVVDTNYIIYNYYLLQKKNRVLDIFIAFIYIICWAYIFFVSMSHIFLMSWEEHTLKIFQDNLEPFSQISLYEDNKNN